MMRHQIQWTAPSPLWAEAAEAADTGVRRALRQPAILRFATDTFMEDFAALLENEPSRLGEFLALPETWREPTPSPDPLAHAPEFVRKLGRMRDAVNRTLDAAGRAPGGQQQQAPAAVARPLVARPSPAKGNALAASQTAGAAAKLKLYQPAHQRFYLVTSCLVCRVPGMPDRALDTAREERVGFVVRRLYQEPPRVSGGQPGPVEEYAFVITPHGQGWRRVEGRPDALAEDEERLPLFAVNFDEAAGGRRRRLYGAMVPVGRREVYMGAGPYNPPTSAAAPNSTPKTARKIHFRMQVAEPWKNLLRVASDARKIFDTAPSDAERNAVRKGSREQAQMISWLILVDFAHYLKTHLPRVWSAVMAGGKSGQGLGDFPQQEYLFDRLSEWKLSGSLEDALVLGTQYTKATHVPPSFADALRRIGRPSTADPDKFELEELLDDSAGPYDRELDPTDTGWPPLIFPLADLEMQDDVPLPPAVIPPPPEGPSDESNEKHEVSQQSAPQTLVDRQRRVDKLVALVVRALEKESAKAAPPPPLAAQAVLDARDGAFVIRCVFERPFCGPLDPPVVSEPSATFQMAGFFDPDAPARPIRIALPIDTTPAGLRKFDKNTAFMISDVLCGQMQRLRGITFADLVLSVLPWPFHRDLPASAGEVGPCKNPDPMGMICTFSLPIITLCALILLMIIVLLFDFIFRWIPFFIMCFPLPGFRGKRR